MGVESKPLGVFQGMNGGDIGTGNTRIQGRGGLLPIHATTQPSSHTVPLMRLLRWWWRPGKEQRVLCEAWVLVQARGKAEVLLQGWGCR